MSKIKSQEEFVKHIYDLDRFKIKLYSLYGDNIKLISDFVHLKKEVTVQFFPCEHIHTIKASNLIYKNNNGCNVCNKNEQKTHEEFCQQVYDLIGDEYTVLEQYINTHTKIKFKHNICGNEYYIEPSGFISGKRCAKCQHRSYKKTTDEFKQEVYNMVQDEYEVLGEYTNNKAKILIRHNICKHEYLVAPSKFLSGRRCPNCSQKIVAEKQRKTSVTFLQEVFNLVGNEYTCLDAYQGAVEKINIKHNTCGNVYSVSPHEFLQGRRCPICQLIARTKKQTWTHKEFCQKIYDIYGDDYTVLGKYVNSQMYIKIRHNECGNEYMCFPNNLIQGKKCAKCSSNLKKTIEEVKEFVESENGYVLISTEYKNAKSPILIKCNNNHIFKTTWDGFRAGHRCGKCKESKGEQAVQCFLRDNNILFDSQYKFKDCKNKRLLPFDFVIFLDTKKQNINCLIEYDGEFHYLPIEGELKLKRQQYNDSIKTNYCIKNNIKLIRIPYWEFDNIEVILQEQLKDLIYMQNIQQAINL